MKERKRQDTSQTLNEMIDRKELLHRIFEIDDNNENKHIQIHEKGLIM